MKFCYNCGAKIEEGDKFCVDCGAELSLAYEEEKARPRAEEETRQKADEELWKRMETDACRNAEEEVGREAAEAEEKLWAEEPLRKSPQIVLARQVAGESEIKEEKRHTSKYVLVFLLVCIAAIGGFVIYGYFSGGHKTGYETIEAAAEKDIELIAQGKEADLFNDITSEEWNVVFNHYKTQLKKVSIASVEELKKAVKERKGEYHYRQDDRPRDLYIKRSVALTRKAASYLPYYMQDLGYDPGFVEIGFTDDRGRTREAYLYYYNKGEKYYTALGLEALDELTEAVVYQGKDKDIEAANKIETAVQAALANEDAYDDVNEFFDSGRVVAAAFGENAFVSTVEKPLNSFLTELNESLGGTAPELQYEGPVNGWKPAGWAVVLYSRKPYVKVYITDGTTNNMVEMYPDVDANYN